MPGQGFNGFPGARQPQPQFAGAAQGQRRPTAGGYVPPRLNAPPPRLARGQSDDRPAPKPAANWKPTPAPVSTTSVVARLKLPSPDDLKVAAPTPAEDWAA